MSLASIVPAVIGGLGLLQGGKQQKQNNDNVQKGLAAQQPQVDAQKALLALAQNYNPAIEDDAAISSAGQETSAALGRGLSTAAGGFSQAGGSPTGDTAFGSIGANLAARTLDPFKQFVAQLRSSEMSRKMGALGQVFSAPAGGISNAYFTAAGMNQPNYGGSLALFKNLFDKITPATTSAGGAAGGFGANPLGTPPTWMAGGGGDVPTGSWDSGSAFG